MGQDGAVRQRTEDLPYRECIDPLFCLTLSTCLGVQVDAVEASVDLRCADLHQLNQSGLQLGLLRTNISMQSRAYPLNKGVRREYPLTRYDSERNFANCDRIPATEKREGLIVYLDPK
jgi:hypothetical protein